MTDEAADTNPTTYAFGLWDQLQPLEEQERKRLLEVFSGMGTPQHAHADIDIILAQDETDGGQARLCLKSKKRGIYKIITESSGRRFYIQPGLRDRCAEVTLNGDGEKQIVLYRDNLTMAVNPARTRALNSCSLTIGGVTQDFRSPVVKAANETLYDIARRERRDWTRRIGSDRTAEEAVVEQADRVLDLAQLQLAG